MAIAAAQALARQDGIEWSRDLPQEKHALNEPLTTTRSFIATEDAVAGFVAAAKADLSSSCRCILPSHRGL